MKDFDTPMTITQSNLRLKIFADGPHKAGVIKGFMTNPTPTRKAGISAYEAFAPDIIEHIPDRPCFVTTRSPAGFRVIRGC